MPGKLLIVCSLVLVVVAGITISADDQVRGLVEHGAKKIVAETDSARSSQDASAKTSSAQNSSSQAAQTHGQTSPKAKPSGPPRVLFITAKGCERCEQELARLRKAGGEFEIMQARGWKIGPAENNHIQIVDRDEIPQLIELLKVRDYPVVAFVSDGEIVRSFKDGCTTPLDSWTFGWLLKGQNERPQGSIPEAARVETTGNYRLRGNHWSVEGDPNPAKQTIVNHLRGPNHGHASGAYGAIDNWSYEELRSLHDDLHEREGGTYGNVIYQQGPVAANRSLDAFSGSRKALGK